jgi:predicted lipoprotein with Yx(FWY)xxD motif
MMHALAAQLPVVLAAEKSRTAFYIVGSVLVGWALVVSLGLGLRRSAFPDTPRLARLVMAISAVLVIATGATGVVTASSPAKTSSAPVTSRAAVAAVKVSAASVAGLGSVLVNSQGHVLYTFMPDDAKKVTCVGACATLWPPLKVSTGTRAVPSGEVKAALISSDPDPEGGSVITYAGWPLYTYVADSGPGTATGQAIQTNGGYWYVISPSGTVIHKAP